MRDSGCVAAKRREGDKCGGRETGDEVRYVNEKEEGKKREKIDDDEQQKHSRVCSKGKRGMRVEKVDVVRVCGDGGGSS